MTAINLKRRVTVPFPANVTGAAGISVSKANGLYTVKLDATQLTQSTVITDGSNQGLFLQNRLTGVTNFLGYTDFVTNVSGNLTVPNGSVTYAKLQNVAASRLLGNATGTSAVAAEISLASTLAFSAGSLSTAALTGDVAATAGSFVTTIQPNVVTYGKIQTVAASRIVGNPTGSVATASEISLGATLAFSGTALQTAAHTGDVTTSANSFATTIAASAVTLGKMANLTGLSVIGNAGTVAATPAATTGTTDQILRVSSAGTALGFGSINLAASAAVGSTILPGANGGTGTGTYAIGDLLQASSTSALARLAATATGNVLISGGVATASTWGKVGLTTHVSGTLAEGNGGTNQATYTLGDLLYSSAANTLSKLGGNITSSKQYLSQTGTGTVSAAPAWAAIAGADVTGSAATQVNDTNVTLTLGGTPATALLRATSFTMGWTGTLAVSRGGTGGGAASGTLLDNISGFASTGFINRTGAGTYSFSSASGVLDGIGATQGNVLFRGAAGWQALATGTAGQVLQTGGAAANPSWVTVTGTGTVTSVGPDSAGKGVYSLVAGTYSTSAAVTASGTLGLTAIAPPGGRLTISTGTPDLTATVSGATSIFYTPYVGQFVPIWNGTVFVLTDMGGELTQTLADTTKSPAAAVASTNYDIFVWNDAGTIRATRGPTWNAGAVAGSNTARGTGAASTELQLLNGFWTNKNAITNGPAANKGTYVGTIRTNASGTLDFVLGTFGAGPGPTTAPNVCLWNQYNRVMWATSFGDTSALYAYTTTTWRQAHGSTTMQISFVTGQNEGIVTADYDGLGQTSSNVGVISVGVDTNSAFTAGATSGLAASNSLAPMHSSWRAKPGLGSHFLSAIEIGDTGVSFVGQRVAGQQAGMSCTGFY